jgi:hypothetical protein
VLFIIGLLIDKFDVDVALLRSMTSTFLGNVLLPCCTGLLSKELNLFGGSGGDIFVLTDLASNADTDRWVTCFSEVGGGGGG